MADGAIAKVAVESIEGLFAKENELEMILLAVQKVGELIKVRARGGASCDCLCAGACVCVEE